MKSGVGFIAAHGSKVLTMLAIGSVAVMVGAGASQGGPGRLEGSRREGPGSVSPLGRPGESSKEGHPNRGKALREWLTAQLHPRDPAGEMIVHSGIPYDSIPGVDPDLLSLDIYTPERPRNLPVMVMVHGGGWHRGDKANENVAAQKSVYFTGMGMVFVSINYRLAPAVQHPENVRDIARALSFLDDHVKDYGGSPEQMVLMGHSAGGHLVSLVSTDETYLRDQGKDLTLIKGTISLDTAFYDINARLEMPGGSRTQEMVESAMGTDEETWREASPINHLSAGKSIPPFLVICAGEGRASLPQSEEFCDGLEACGIPATLEQAEDKSHESLNADIGTQGDEATAWITRFTREVLTR